MRTTLIATLSTLCLAAATLPAQTAAAVLPFGTACRDFSNTILAPVMTVTGVPTLGSPVRINYLGPQGVTANVERSIPFLLTGTSTAALPVPRLTPLMADNCYLWLNLDVAAFPMPLVSPSSPWYQTSLTYTIPNVPAVIGATVFHQWAVMVMDTLHYQNWVLKYVMFSNAMGIRAGL